MQLKRQCLLMADGARAAAAAAVAVLDLRRQVADMQRDLKELREKVCLRRVAHLRS